MNLISSLQVENTFINVWNINYNQMFFNNHLKDGIWDAYSSHDVVYLWYVVLTIKIEKLSIAVNFQCIITFTEKQIIYSK